MQYETVQVCVDENTISAGDSWPVVEPVYWTANIYDGPENYELSLLEFSRPQRQIFAIHWYNSEVNNGGHHQFFSNPTGIVWKDALEGFQAMVANEHAAILAESAARIGGSPSLDRYERGEQLDTFDPDFSDLDERFYNAKETLQERVLAFIRAHAPDFYFKGMIRRVVFPK